MGYSLWVNEPQKQLCGSDLVVLLVGICSRIIVRKSPGAVHAEISGCCASGHLLAEISGGCACRHLLAVHAEISGGCACGYVLGLSNEVRHATMQNQFN